MLTDFIKKAVYREKYSSETYVAHLRRLGVEIGDDCTIYAPTKTLIDLQYPWLITIGNHVRITQGVIILTHDYSWSVLKRLQNGNIDVPGAIFGASGEVTIGNNVFIGMNAIILRNVQIGNNVIIGSGSVVTKNCEDNGVYAGNPAKKLMNINEYYEKRKQVQLAEARQLAIRYYERYGIKPPETIFHEYFMLFSTPQEVSSMQLKKLELCGNSEESLEYMKNHTPDFPSYNQFLRYCFPSE